MGNWDIETIGVNLLRSENQGDECMETASRGRRGGGRGGEADRAVVKLPLRITPSILIERGEGKQK